jgi:hypothetical protein
MKTLKYPLVALLAFSLSPSLSLTGPANAGVAQTQGSTALERGYRTGYSDGYNAGFKDMSDRANNDYRSKDDYQRADRAYVDAWGPIEDYRDGYQQGYETGYAAGYDRRPFESSIPAGFKRRGAPGAGASSGDVGVKPDATQSPAPDANQSNPSGSSPNMSGPLRIPSGTNLVVELMSQISTDVSQRGDQFQARVVEPREFEGAIVHGRITRLQRPGKVKGTAEMQLTFDEIRLTDNRTTNIHAEVVEVIDNGGSNGVGEVDKEGGVKGKSSTKDDVTKVGAAAGVGALIGAIVGGGKGAAIGAAIGGGVGAGGVLSSSGKDIRLQQGQRLRIRTSTDTNVQ